MCRLLGWVSPTGSPDTTRLKRALGLTPNSSCGRGEKYYRKMQTGMRPHTAETLCERLNLDPIEMGI